VIEDLEYTPIEQNYNIVS